MKVLKSESTLDPDYIGDVVVSCDKTEIKFPGSDEVFHMECIVDDANGEIYYYEPKLARYATDKLLHGNDLDIWKVLKNPEYINEVFLDAHGDEFKDFAVKWNGLQKKSDGDEVYKTKVCKPIIGKFSESKAKNGEGRFFTKAECLKRARLSKATLAKSGDLNARIAPWYAKAFPTDKEMIAELRLCRSTFQDVVDALDNGEDVYDAIGVGDSVVRERVFGALCDLTGKDYDYFYDKWLNGGERYSRFSENLDNPNDWSASEGEVEIVWNVDFPEADIEAGDTEHFVVDYDLVLPNDYDIESNCLKEEVCNLIRKEYPDLDFDETDFDITNEREFWGDEATRHIYPYDESGELDKMNGEDIVRKIPNWATTYIMYGDMPDNLNDEDIQMVDDFLDELASQGIALISPIEGTESGFEPHPAFGDACDTTDWSCETSID